MEKRTNPKKQLVPKEETKKHTFLRRGGSGSGSRSPNKNVSPNRPGIRPTSKGKVATPASPKAPEVKMDPRERILADIKFKKEEANNKILNKIQ